MFSPGHTVACISVSRVFIERHTFDPLSKFLLIELSIRFPKHVTIYTSFGCLPGSAIKLSSKWIVLTAVNRISGLGNIVIV